MVRRPPESASVGALCRVSVHVIGPLMFGDSPLPSSQPQGSRRVPQHLPVRWCIDTRDGGGCPDVESAASGTEFAVVERSGAVVEVTIAVPLQISHIGFETPARPAPGARVPDRFKLTGVTAESAAAAAVTAAGKSSRRFHRVKKGKFVKGTSGVQWFEFAQDRVVPYVAMRIEVLAEDGVSSTTALELAGLHFVGFKA